jgi:hypothetical protein
VLRSSVLGTTQKRVQKASVLSNPSRKAGDRPVTSQCPSKKHGPLRRTKCGRRERESRREGRREQSLREQNSFACRDGQRHPGFPDGGALRGAPSERRPRLVRFECSGSLLQASAPVTADVRRAPRRGTPSACATKRMHPSRAREIVASEQRGRVLRSVLRPVHVNPHYALERQLSEVRRTRRHHGWANSRK